MYSPYAGTNNPSRDSTRLPPPIKLTATILLKVALTPTTLTQSQKLYLKYIWEERGIEIGHSVTAKE
jgi:hypothetical protein